MAKKITELKELWSATQFEEPALTEYAEAHLLEDTRKGVAILGFVSMMLLASGAFLYGMLGYEPVYIYTCGFLAFFSSAISFATGRVERKRDLYLLGMTLLVVIGVGFVLLAHRYGAYATGLYLTVVLLFMVMPLVPWGLREATVTVAMVYSVLTLSTLSVKGRFDDQTLLLLQFLMLAGGMVTLTVIARALDVRKEEIRLRFFLERAHDEMEKLSTTDPLTGAGNRRQLDSSFRDLYERLKARGPVHFVLLDVDDFKQVNDQEGHDFGDLVLRQMVRALTELLGDEGYVFRLGGDEFALLTAVDDPDALIDRAGALMNGCEAIRSKSRVVGISRGIRRMDDALAADLDRLYAETDDLLYKNKFARKGDRRCHRNRPWNGAGDTVKVASPVSSAG